MKLVASKKKEIDIPALLKEFMTDGSFYDNRQYRPGLTIDEMNQEWGAGWGEGTKPIIASDGKPFLAVHSRGTLVIEGLRTKFSDKWIKDYWDEAAPKHWKEWKDYLWKETNHYLEWVRKDLKALELDNKKYKEFNSDFSRSWRWLNVVIDHYKWYKSYCDLLKVKANEAPKDIDKIKKLLVAIVIYKKGGTGETDKPSSSEDG